MYLWIKYIHIFIAIISLGSSAGLGIVLEFFGNHPVHGLFVLRAIKRVVAFLVIPGYMLMLFSGMFMLQLAWSWEDTWLIKTLIFWSAGMVIMIISEVLLANQIKMFETKKTDLRSYKVTSFLVCVFGAAGGLIVVFILYYSL